MNDEVKAAYLVVLGGYEMAIWGAEDGRPIHVYKDQKYTPFHFIFNVRESKIIRSLYDSLHMVLY